MVMIMFSKGHDEGKVKVIVVLLIARTVCRQDNSESTVTAAWQ